MEILKAKLTPLLDAIMKSAELTDEWLEEKWTDKKFLSAMGNALGLLSLLLFLAVLVANYAEDVDRRLVSWLITAAFVVFLFAWVFDTKFWSEMCASYRRIISDYREIAERYYDMTDEQNQQIESLLKKVAQYEIEEIVREANEQITGGNDNEIRS